MNTDVPEDIDSDLLSEIDENPSNERQCDSYENICYSVVVTRNNIIFFLRFVFWFVLLQ